MKNLVTTMVICLSAVSINVNAQETIVHTDGFETTDGFPADFSSKKVLSWASAKSPYTGKFWNDTFASYKEVEGLKALLTEVDTKGAHTGSQCLKLSLPNALLVQTEGTDGMVNNFISIRSQKDVLSFAEGETIGKYQVTVWAKVGGDKARKVFRNEEGDPIEVGTEWKEYTLAHYTPGTNSTLVKIDLVQQDDQADYVVYLDDFKLVKTDIVSGIDNHVVANDNGQLKPSYANGYITVDGVESIDHVSIYNIMGHKVIDQGCNQGNSISIGVLAKGLYIVKTTHGNQVFLGQLLVK